MATEAAGTTQPNAPRRSPLVAFEIAATVILAMATVATAWSGYQATRWGQETTRDQSALNGSRILAGRADDLANTQSQIDVATFIAWVDAYAEGEVVEGEGTQETLADFYYARFREEFKPAVDAWVATQPLKDPDAPLTPFAMPEYHLAARDEAAAQDAATDAKAVEVRSDLERQSNYVLAVVLFATVLFLAGVSTRLNVQGVRLAMLGLGCVIFIGTMIWIATFPVSVSI